MPKRATKRDGRSSASKKKKITTRRKPLTGPVFKLEVVKLADLTPHPRNYRKHTADQLAHLIESMRDNGVYRNVVVARDNTILAGHGVVLAARKMRRTDLPVIRLDVKPEDPRALNVLAGDNEVARLADVDDRALTDMLKEINELDGLLGTGYDERMLAALTFVTRPASEVADFDAAAEWVGMPEFDPGDSTVRLIVSFLTKRDRQKFVKQNRLRATHRSGSKGQAPSSATKEQAKVWSAWWPRTERDDAKSVIFEG